MKALAVFVLGWVLVPLLALAQEKVALNTITSVKVNGSTVEITGTQKPNFTTFTLTDPPRLVIDISEAVLKGVPEELRVGKGLITGLRSANYGAEGAAIARILIGYERDVEADIVVSNHVLTVKVLDGSGPLVAQADTGTRAPTQGTTAAGTEENTAQATTAATADREAQDKAAAEATAAAQKTEEERRKQEEAARAEAERRTQEERKAQELAAAEEKKRQEEAARAEAEARKLAEADEKRRQQELAQAEAEAKKQAEADEKKRKAEEAEARRVALLEEKKRKQDEARAQAEARKQAEADEKRRKAEEAEARRVALLEEKKRKQDEARAQVEARKQAEADEKRRRAQEAEARRQAALDNKRQEAAAREARVASAEVPRRTEVAESALAGNVSARRKTLEIVGFQPQPGGARVYVRTNEPVSYKVSEGRNEIVLELENTQIGKGNNTRALDTSFFDTAVARVDPTVGPDRSVRVSIKLKSPVSVRTRQEGNTISLEFPRR
jgi:hypothetical protein